MRTCCLNLEARLFLNFLEGGSTSACLFWLVVSVTVEVIHIYIYIYNIYIYNIYIYLCVCIYIYIYIYMFHLCTLYTQSVQVNLLRKYLGAPDMKQRSLGNSLDDMISYYFSYIFFLRKYLCYHV